MRKFFAKLALFLLPLAIYIGLFAAFDLNDYFGTQGRDTFITRIKGYKASGTNSVILGDSRLAHMNAGDVEKAAGRPFYNLAFGGSSVDESIELVRFAKEQNPNLNEVVFGLSFYTLNSTYATQNRIATIEKQIKNPVAYISNLQNNMQLSITLLGGLRGVPMIEGIETAEHTPDEYVQNGETLKYRKNLAAYASVLYSKCAKPGTLTLAKPNFDQTMAAIKTNALHTADLIREMENATPVNASFEITDETITKLQELTDYCRNNEIKLYYVFPPIHSSVRNLVCESLGIDVAMKKPISALRQTSAVVLDYEWEHIPDYPDEYYFDGFHLDVVHGLPIWVNTLFSDINAKR